jgi:hypothetical protein
MLYLFTPVFAHFLSLTTAMLYHRGHAVPRFAPRTKWERSSPVREQSGTTGYHAQLLIKRKGTIVHSESRTFDRKQAAAAWLEKRETELAKPGALEREKTPYPTLPYPTLASVIDRYTEESVKDIGRTKMQVLRAIRRYDIANQQCSTITSADIIAFANQLVSKVTPWTIANYLSHLAPVFAIARPAWGYQLDQNAMKDAFVVAKRLGIATKSRARDRRPTAWNARSLRPLADRKQARG